MLIDDSSPYSGLPDVAAEIHEIISRVTPFTMTSAERMAALCEAAAYVVQHKIAGAFVECGVWKGGSSMAAALTFLRLQARIPLYLFDTFEGMSQPTAADHDFLGRSAAGLLAEADRTTSLEWAFSPLEQVQRNIASTGYPPELTHYIKGRVEDTIPERAPEAISILRLDTDWYESTRHELEHLFPRLAVGGVLIIDDYGHWMGARRAVDEYLQERRLPILLNRIDYTGRIAVKARLFNAGWF